MRGLRVQSVKTLVDGPDRTDWTGRTALDGTDWTGRTGRDGLDWTGRTGLDGTDWMGRTGRDGLDGTDWTGRDGLDGTDGRTGRDGLDGRAPKQRGSTQTAKKHPNSRVEKTREQNPKGELQKHSPNSKVSNKTSKV